MSGVYIPGMGFPEDEQLVIITPDGMAMNVGPAVTKLRATQAVPVPDHGDLIERDALVVAYDAEHVGPPGRARELMMEAPTIIPEDKEAET